MTDAEIKQAFEEYRKREGRNKTIGALTSRGLSPTFAERAANGDWRPKRITHRTRNVMLDILGLLKAS